MLGVVVVIIEVIHSCCLRDEYGMPPVEILNISAKMAVYMPLAYYLTPL